MGTLNSRCSILAAANSVFGRWDDSKAEENIDFMPTILSRFDTIFIVKDEHNEDRDTVLAKHVMQVHMNAAADTATEGEQRLAIPITVRQLEAVVRISESLAKMELQPFATDS